MHYYPFNIGDHTTHTGHLTPIEDIIYRRLLDWYYLHEKPIPNNYEETARLIRVNDRSTDVQQVLNEFFFLCEDGWHNKHADEVIEKFNSTRVNNSKAGKLSAKARKQKGKTSQRAFNERSTTVQPTNNQKPITKTNNQEPNNTHGVFKPEQDYSTYPHFVDLNFTNLYHDFIEMRAKARKPASKKAQELILSKLHDHGVDVAKKMLENSIMNGWQGVFPIGGTTYGKNSKFTEGPVSKVRQRELDNQKVIAAWLASKGGGDNSESLSGDNHVLSKSGSDKG